jgi:hypothetical protein
LSVVEQASYYRDRLKGEVEKLRFPCGSGNIYRPIVKLWLRKYLGTRLENKNTLDGNPDSAQATQDVEVPLKGFLVVRHPKSKG